MLSVVLEDIATNLTHSCAEIKDAIIKLGWGKRSSKDFLAKDVTDIKIQRNKTARKRRCIAIYLFKMPDDLREIFVKCKLIYTGRMGVHTQ